MTTEAPDIQEDQDEVHDAVPMVASGPTNAAIKFDVTTAAIAEMRTKADSLTIAGPDDKTGYNLVFETRQAVKRQRVAVQAKQKSLKRPHIDYNRDVDAAADLLIEPMAKIEDDLARKEKAYKDENERIAEEKARLARVRFGTRTKELQAWGFAYDPALDTYSFGALIINVDDIRDLSDEDYEPTKLAAQELYQIEQQRLADIELAAQQEAQRIADGQEAERVRLRAIADQQAEAQRKLDEQQAELKRQEEELTANLKKLQDEKDANLLTGRIDRLLAAGFTKVTGSLNTYHHFSVKIREGVILSFADEQFDSVISDAEARNQKQAEVEAYKLLFDKRDAQLLEAGFHYDFTANCYTFGNVSVQNGDVTGYLDDEFNAIIIDAIQRDQQATLDKQKADTVRQERLKDDKDILKELFRIPEERYTHAPLTQPETQALATQFFERYEALLTEYSQLVEAL